MLGQGNVHAPEIHFTSKLSKNEVTVTQVSEVKRIAVYNAISGSQAFWTTLHCDRSKAD
jgi:hypothetical protein